MGLRRKNTRTVMSIERRTQYQSAQQRQEKTSRRPNEWLLSIEYPFGTKNEKLASRARVRVQIFAENETAL